MRKLYQFFREMAKFYPDFPLCSVVCSYQVQRKFSSEKSAKKCLFEWGAISPSTWELGVGWYLYLSWKCDSFILKLASVWPSYVFIWGYALCNVTCPTVFAYIIFLLCDTKEPLITAPMTLLELYMKFLFGIFIFGLLNVYKYSCLTVKRLCVFF